METGKNCDHRKVWVVDRLKQSAGLTALGYRVGTIKHTHHHHELDTPGKDSHRHRQAGAAVVGILSPGMTAVLRPNDQTQESTEPYDRLLAAMFADCDLVLVETNLRTTAKAEVWRAAVTESPIAAQDSSILAGCASGGLREWCASGVREWGHSILSGVREWGFCCWRASLAQLVSRLNPALHRREVTLLERLGQCRA